MNTTGPRKVTISQHALDEATKDFRVRRELAEGWIRSKLRQAKFIANVVSADGKPARLYAFERIAIILADTEDYVLTLYPRHIVVDEVRTKVDAIVRRALRQAERRVKAAERKAAVEKARLNREIAECEWRMTITPSKRVIAVNTARIDEIKREIAKIDADLMREKKEASAIAKSVVAYV